MAERTEITEVYQGRAHVVFHVGRHFYTVAVPGVHDRLYQPGVTSIIGIKDKPALIGWAVKQMNKRTKELAKEYAKAGVVNLHELGVILSAAEESYREAKEDAAEVGKVAHGALEAYLKTGTVLRAEESPLMAPGFTEKMVLQANRAIEAGMEFFSQHSVKVLASETPRWSPTYGYIGTNDLVAMVDGFRDVLDFKSSSGIFPETRLQTVAYGQAWEEEFPDQLIDRRTVVNIGRDGKLAVKSYGRDTWNEDFIAFRALFAAWKWERANGNWPKDPIEILGPLDKLVPRP